MTPAGFPAWMGRAALPGSAAALLGSGRTGRGRWRPRGWEAARRGRPRVVASRPGAGPARPLRGRFWTPGVADVRLIGPHPEAEPQRRVANRGACW